MKPTDAEIEGRIEKLPQWARDHFADIKRRKDEAVDRLEKYLDDDTPSAFYETIAPGIGPDGRCVFRDRYINANSISCKLGDLVVTVMPDGERRGVEVRFMSERGAGQAVLLPVASNVIRIVELTDRRS